jgi:hypothetical protein
MEQMQALLAKEELSLALFEAWNTKEVGEEMLCEVGKKIREKYGNYDAAQADASLWADFKEKYVKSGKKWASNIKARLLLRWAFPGHKAVDDGRYYKLVDGKPVFDKERTDKAKKDKKAKAKAEEEEAEEGPVVAVAPTKAAGGGALAAPTMAAGGGGAQAAPTMAAGGGGAQAAPTMAAGGGGAAPEAGVDALAGAFKSMAIGGGGAAAAAVEGPACSLCKKPTASAKDCTLCKQSVGDCHGSIMTRGRYTGRFVCHSTCQDSAAWAVEEPTTDTNNHDHIKQLVREAFYTLGSDMLGERHPVNYVVKATKGDTITFQKIVSLALVHSPYRAFGSIL